MFSYDFRSHNDKAIYGPPVFFRVLCGVFLFFLLVGLFTVITSDSWNAMGIIPLCVIVLLLFCLLYRDSWIFDNKTKQITYVWGFGSFVRKEEWKYSDVQRIEITHFIKGIPETAEKQTPSWRHKTQVVMSVRFDAEKKKDLEIMGEKKSGGKLERNASWLSGFSGLALYVDRPKDTKPRK